MWNSTHWVFDKFRRLLTKIAERQPSYATVFPRANVGLYWHTSAIVPCRDVGFTPATDRVPVALFDPNRSCSRSVTSVAALQRHRALLLYARCLHDRRPNRQFALDALCKID